MCFRGLAVGYFVLAFGWGASAAEIEILGPDEVYASKDTRVIRVNNGSGFPLTRNVVVTAGHNYCDFTSGRWKYTRERKRPDFRSVNIDVYVPHCPKQQWFRVKEVILDTPTGECHATTSAEQRKYRHNGAKASFQRDLAIVILEERLCDGLQPHAILPIDDHPRIRKIFPQGTPIRATGYFNAGLEGLTVVRGPVGAPYAESRDGNGRGQYSGTGYIVYPDDLPKGGLVGRVYGHTAAVGRGASGGPVVAVTPEGIEYVIGAIVGGRITGVRFNYFVGFSTELYDRIYQIVDENE